ncbi:hypothetical protein F4809DRAFT_421662 [Biscogniauxia mediterranea]|nr:hypothetical protein F4809DRAFT_421662 [Biscogniauxia mediterranea]
MADPRYRPSGRRSPTFNPARASMPVNIGYSPPYNGDIHAIPTSRYDTAGVRRPHDHKTPVTPAATITTYNVTKDPLTRSASTSRHRASTAEPGPVKPIIVTTNHARPHASSSHTATTSSSGRTASPSRDAYRSSEETYYTQPASSVRSRSQHRQSHSYSQSATLSNDEFYRLRERVGDDRLRAPARAGTDSFRHARPISLYAATPPPAGSTPAVDYEDEGYEYTKPSDLARYDLSHEREARRGRRESIDRGYHRPHVNVMSNDPAARYEPRNRAKPPAAPGIDRYNRAAAAGVYDRPSVTMPAPPAVPPPPMVEAGRRPALLEAPSSPTVERRSSRPRPVSLYQESPARASHPDELYRSRDDERLHRDRRERDDTYRDDAVAIRGFGIRTDTLDQPARPSSASNYRDQDDPRARRDTEDHAPQRRSDESLPSAKPVDDARLPTNGIRDRRESMSLNRKNSISERARERFTAGLAAMGIGPKEDAKAAPRRNSDDEKESAGTRAADRYKPQDKDAVERRPTPREDIIVEPRREPRRERAASVSSSRERVGLDRERDKDRERGRERDKSRDREQYRRDAESKLNGSALDPRDISPDSIDSETGPRRRPRSASFNPTDARVLMDLKAELAARDGSDKPGEKSTTKDAVSEKDTNTPNGSGKQELELNDESRGRELVPAREEKQVRVVSPPREKTEQKPLKGILKTPSAKFPEDNNPIREGVAPHKDDKTKKDVPNGARWTKISRRMVNPEALSIGKERFEVRDEFVIVLRVLSKDEIQAYAVATAQLRELRRKEHEREARYDRYSDEERNRSDEERQRRTRHRREEDDEYRKGGHGRERDDRHRRHRISSDDEDDRRPKAIEYETGGSNHRTYRDYDSVTTNSDDRR